MSLRRCRETEPDQVESHLSTSGYMEVLQRIRTDHACSMIVYSEVPSASCVQLQCSGTASTRSVHRPRCQRRGLMPSASPYVLNLHELRGIHKFRKDIVTSHTKESRCEYALCDVSNVVEGLEGLHDMKER
jgi:hypothetical protein